MAFCDICGVRLYGEAKETCAVCLSEIENRNAYRVKNMFRKPVFKKKEIKKKNKRMLSTIEDDDSPEVAHYTKFDFKPKWKSVKAKK